MNSAILSVLLISLSGFCYSADSVVDDTELLLTFLAGKRRSYQLGQFIRRRYDELLSPTFNKSEIYVRSTDSTRAKMTVLTALAAVYPAPTDNWSDKINWTPIPYTTVIAGEDVQRVQIYSAHDLNVFAFEGVTRVAEKQGVPKYASAYALELRKVVDTGDHIVVPVYLNTPSEDVITYLEIEECGQRCAYESFRSVTSIYNLEESVWRTECGFSEDMVIDSSSVD
ncbi:hypothetical protein HF086_000054 [Spodoptera exigua]|uniref:acid phosphatase n=1 Tax=Spodoptera exigua TaxID=7107 RepID=A0A922MXS1_SPOEX|nr:hypothetical protein HF086_000054 [Spodoptera exigua]